MISRYRARVSLSAIPLAKPSTDEAEVNAVAAVLQSGWIAGQGPMGTELESAFAQLARTTSGIAVSNCTAGLHLLLATLGVAAGDEVLVADYSFPATGLAVMYCGATPVFVDVRADTATVDVDLLEQMISPRTRGIIAVDALGMPADWHRLERIAQNRGLFLIEDAACAAGGELNGRACGGFGDAAVFSLHARKGVTCGEGGVITTNDAGLAAEARQRANFGMSSAFQRQAGETFTLPDFSSLGYNYKLSDILAAVALIQVSKLRQFHERRQALATTYGETLAGMHGITVPHVPPDRTPTWQTYAVTLDEGIDRNSIILGMRQQSIACNIGTYSLHRLPVFDSIRSECPTSRALFERHLALPMFPDLTISEQYRVVDALARVMRQAT